MVALQRQEAECLGYEQVPYDALLENYEPGARTADIARMFAALRAELTPLLSAIAGSRRRRKLAILKRNYPVERQHAFAVEAAVVLGFDFQRGRVDTSVHPFSTSMATGDCRIAIRYDANYFSDAFFALLHEVGHGLYEQGLNPAHEGTPFGSIISLGLHESQSRLWENMVGRSLPFWKYFFPRARQAFPEALGKVSMGDFFLAVNHVEPSSNRVQADEVTYNLHVLVRFELEQAMIGGQLAVADLPGAWNDAYKAALGVTVPNDAAGCLQDGHWSEGLIGYFPTYTLGNLFAAQLYARARADLGKLDAAFSQGDFSALLEWLRDQVYHQGGRFFGPALIEKATGRAPDHRPLVEGLKNKFTELYSL
jgi:carboxypeptidase Taq